MPAMKPKDELIAGLRRLKNLALHPPDFEKTLKYHQ